MNRTIFAVVAIGALFAAPAVWAQPAEADAQAGGTAAVGVSATVPPEPVAATAPAPAPTPARVVVTEESAWSDKSRTLGVGADVTIGGIAGMHARYFFSPLLGFQLTVGYGSRSTTTEPEVGEDIENDLSILLVGVGAIYRIFGWDDGLLALTFGVDIASVSAKTSAPPVPDIDSSATVIGGNVGLHAELFLADFFSIHGQTGVRVQTASGEQGDADTSGFALSIAGDVLTGFGFTFWLI